MYRIIYRFGFCKAHFLVLALDVRQKRSFFAFLTDCGVRVELD